MVRRRRGIVAALVAASSVAGVAIACSSYGGAGADPDASGSPDGFETDGGTPDPCEHVAAPGPPDVEDEGESLPPFSMAVRSIRVGAEVGKLQGLDLDRTCTCDTRPGTAFGGAPSCGTKQVCDDPGGLDNALGPLAATFRAYFDVDDVYRQLIADGFGTVLLQVSEYNGRRNDKHVSVAMLIAEGIPSPDCPESTQEPTTMRYRPGWCGDDTWVVARRSMLTKNVPATVYQGWVNDGVLVVRAGESAGLDLGILGPEYRDVVVYGRLVPLGEDLAPRDPDRAPTGREARLFRLEDAVLAARIPTRSVLAIVGQIGPVDGGGPRLCKNARFSVVKQSICAASDIASDKSTDHQPGAKCDAISAGYLFDAEPAIAGDISDLPPFVTPCSPEADWSTDAGVSYSCD